MVSGILAISCSVIKVLKKLIL